MDDLCEICGNEVVAGMTTCPFCGRKYTDGSDAGTIQPHRVVNIELGRPVVDRALERLAGEVERARLEGVAVITVIHGYGASGRGGAIRRECRKMLDHYKSINIIRGYIPGESFSRKHGPTKALLRRLPLLTGDANLNRGNRGITIVEM